MADPVPLRRFHADRLYLVRRYKISLEYWQRQPTEKIVQSLKHQIGYRDYQEFLKVRKDGLILQGNTRVKVLEERGYNLGLLHRSPADD
jgi:hypothetical protein